MKYKIVVISPSNVDVTNIFILEKDEMFTSFPAEIGNSNYDQFLVDAKLTDKQVKALKSDVWYDFPEGDK
jgi:invasion protein IalB